MRGNRFALVESLFQDEIILRANSYGKMLRIASRFMCIALVLFLSRSLYSNGQGKYLAVGQYLSIVANCFKPLPTHRFRQYLTSSIRSRPGSSDGQPPPRDAKSNAQVFRVSAPLACPVSLQKLDADGLCLRSGLQYAKKEDQWDLTVGAAISAPKDPASVTEVFRSILPRELRGLLPQSRFLGTSQFETPQVAFAYERGWRQGFVRAGFPGPDEEFNLAEAALRPFADGKVLVDASCGSGLFTRRFAKSKNYGHVIALDFSDAMLRQARSFAAQEGLIGDNLTFVRADIARLPFPEGSVGGVHAGAAIHCWPDPRIAVAEIARILEPGATFCGSTFLSPQIPFADDKLQQTVDAAVRDLRGSQVSIRYWNKQDLSDLMKICGLVNLQFQIRNGRTGEGFIFYSASKPPNANFM